MYNPNSTEFSNNNRKITATLLLGATDLSIYLQSFTLNEDISSGNAITMGTTNSSSVEVTLINLPNGMKANLYKGASFTLSIKADSGSNVPLGKFYIDAIDWSEFHNTNNLSCRITAYDGFYKTTGKYSTSYTSNTTISALITEICGRTGLPKASGVWDSSSVTITTIPTECTDRDIIGYLAGLMGKVAFINRSGALSCKWYTSCSKTIGRDEQYSDSLTFNDGKDGALVTIKMAESGTGNSIFTYPSDTSVVVGEAISFENPLIDSQEKMNVVGAKIKSGSTYLINFNPLQVKWRGDPHIETGEIVKVKDKGGNDAVCYVMARTINYDGGLYEEYTCYGENEQSVTFSNVPVKKLERQLNVVDQTVKEATNVLFNENVSGGIFEITKAGTPPHSTGWKIYDGNNPNTFIVANRGGIFYSVNGANPVGAIYFKDGGVKVFANDIVSHTVTTEMLAFTPITDTNLMSSINNSTVAINGGKISNISAIPGYNNLNTTVSAASTNATEAKEKVNSWAVATDSTFIDGSKIFTGTIYANRFTIGGWNNLSPSSDSSKWSGDTSYFSFGQTDAVSGFPKIGYNYNQTSSERAITTRTYVGQFSEGTVITCSATVCPFGETATTLAKDCYIGFWIMTSSSPDGTYYGQVYASSSVSDSTTKVGRERTIKTSYTITSSAPYVKIKIYFYNCSSDSYITDLFVTTTDEDGKGTIRASNGGMYLDFFKGELGIRSANYKMATAEYYAKVGNLSTEMVGLIFDTYNGSQSGYFDADLTKGYMLYAHGQAGDTSTNSIIIHSDSVIIDNLSYSSTESVKENITESESVLEDVRSSKIYNYDYTYNQDRSIAGDSSSDSSVGGEYGFISERETPSALLSSDGKHIKAYSMMSMNWKATQELLEKIEELENRVNELEQ